MSDPAGSVQPEVTEKSHNRFELTASLLQREALRYSPAGIALCQALVEHESTQPEMGQERAVRLVMAARFSGVLAERITRESLGSQLLISGFLCPKRLFKDSKPSGALQIHVTEYQLDTY